MAELQISAIGAISGEVLGSLAISETCSVAELKRRLTVAHHWPGAVKLFHDGQQISGPKTLVDAGLRNGAEIQVIISRSQQILAGAMDGTGSIWDLEGPQKAHEFHHGAELHTAAVSPDGKFLGTAGSDCQVILWQRDPLDVEFNLQGHQGQVYSISFCPVSSTLLSASGDATARLWEISSGQELLCLRGHRRDVNACAISPDGQVLATGSDDYCFATWDRRSGQMIHNWDGRRGEGHSGRVYSVAFSPDGYYLATGAVDKKAKIWDTRAPSGSLLATKHSDLVNSVQFSVDGNLVASASDDSLVFVWKPMDGTMVACHEHPMAVLSCSFADDGHLATGCSDGKLRIWSTAESEPVELNASSNAKSSLRGIKSATFIPA